ncbi:MAG: FAD-dependent oxidoreductase [Rhodopseudomonas palustris]|nr:FAD-dependent oxidoreductase [Rhodopseudomonas palustris]
MKRLVLAGGGHAHLAVLNALARDAARGTSRWRWSRLRRSRPTPACCRAGSRVTTHVAQIEIDLEALARRANVTLLRDCIGAVDANRRCVAVSDRQHLQYDVLSLDVGSEIDTSWRETLGDRLLPLRPIAGFLERWPGMLATARKRRGFRIAVVGAGAAGIEVALAVRHAFDRERVDGEVCLVAPREKFLAGHGPGARRRVADWMRRAGVELHDGHAVGTRDGLLLPDGSTILVDGVIAATGAAPPAG